MMRVFNGQGTTLSKAVIDFPFAIDDLSKLFDVVDLLENKETLIEDFKPEVSKLMVKKDFFTGPFRAAYQDAFDDLIVRLIRSQIVNHFPGFTGEEIMALTNKDFLKMVTDGVYFDPDNYLTKEEPNLN